MFPGWQGGRQRGGGLHETGDPRLGDRGLPSPAGPQSFPSGGPGETGLRSGAKKCGPSPPKGAGLTRNGGPGAARWAPPSLVLGNPDRPPSAVLAPVSPAGSLRVTAATELWGGSRPRMVLAPGRLGTGGADSTAWGREVTNTRGPELAHRGRPGPLLPASRLWDRQGKCLCEPARGWGLA